MEVLVSLDITTPSRFSRSFGFSSRAARPLRPSRPVVRTLTSASRPDNSEGISLNNFKDILLILLLLALKD
uniref:Uncharacterized protein n=1 Tax=Glossina brevipalpis TaxID=37001 RepID=A0A1A9X2C2_9MUSC